MKTQIEFLAEFLNNKNNGHLLVSVVEQQLQEGFEAYNRYVQNYRSAETPILRNGVVIIDFDGTLCKHCFPFVGDPEPGVREALKMIRELGFIIRIHSCRTATYWNKEEYRSVSLSPNKEPREKHIQLIQEFMEENDLPYDEIILDETMDKPVAEFYIDDRAIGYNGDWTQTINELERRM